MENKLLLLLISKNTDLTVRLEAQAEGIFDTRCVSNVHAGFSTALEILPDAILVDYASTGLEALRNIEKFRSCHFLKKSAVFLLGDKENEKILNKNFKDVVDGILSDENSSKSIVEKLEEAVLHRKGQRNYWKDSFMGLFNLLSYPVLLLQDQEIICVNDAFKRDFFITGNENLHLCDLVHEQNRSRVEAVLRKFTRGKHIKASTTTNLLMNDRSKEAKITFSKLDRSLPGQVIMMINFTGRELPINKEIGSPQPEKDNLASEPSANKENYFTRREKEIITLLCKGYKTREISEALCISSKTIEKHRANITRRTHSGTILESIVYALNNKIIEV